MWPKHFQRGDGDRNITVDAHRKALETDIKIYDEKGEWVVLSYYYCPRCPPTKKGGEEGYYVLDIQRKDSTFVEGWNAVLKNNVEEGKNTREQGNSKYRRGWDACMKADAPDWMEDEAEAKQFLKRKRKHVRD